MLPDPDPDSQYGSGSGSRTAKPMRDNADPHPQHWFFLSLNVCKILQWLPRPVYTVQYMMEAWRPWLSLMTIWKKVPIMASLLTIDDFLVSKIAVYVTNVYSTYF
jgi:hypothetical protein